MTSNVTWRTSTAAATASATSIGIDYPSDLKGQDDVFLGIIFNATTGTPTTPTNWTQVGSDIVFSSTNHVALYHRTASGTDGATATQAGNTLTVSFSGTGQKFAASMVAGRAAGTWDLATKANGTDTTTWTTPTVTNSSSANGANLFVMVFQRSSTPATSVTNSSGLTAGAAAYGTGGGATVAASGYATTNIASSAASGTTSWTQDGSAVGWVQLAVALGVRETTPTANAGPDQTSVNMGATVTLNGSGSSDADPGDTLTYAWTQTSGTSVTLSDSTAASPTFTAPNTVGNLVFSLVVTDSFGTASSADTVTITTVNRTPTANAGPDQTSVNMGATVTLNGTGSSDPDPGDTLTYAWSQLSGTTVTLSSSTASSPTFTAPNTVGTMTFQLVVTDNHGQASAGDTVAITTVNRNPTANAGADQTGKHVGDVVTLDGTASSDPDSGDTLTYAWTQTGGTTVSLSSSTAAQPTFTVPNNSQGTLTFSLVVTDSHGGSSSADTMTVTVVNRNPTANAGPDQTVGSSSTVTLDGTASSDPDTGDTLTYAWSQTSGTAVSLSSSTAAQPTFTSPGSSGTLVFSLTVTDNHSGSSSADTVTITVSNTAPTANAGPDQSNKAAGATITLDGTSSTATGGHSLSYAWTQTGGPVVTLASGTTTHPTFTAPGTTAGCTMTFRLTVTDTTTSVTATDTVSIAVNAHPTLAAARSYTPIIRS